MSKWACGVFVVAASFDSDNGQTAGVVLLNAMDVSVKLAERNKNMDVN